MSLQYNSPHEKITIIRFSTDNPLDNRIFTMREFMLFGFRDRILEAVENILQGHNTKNFKS
jgi:hypothetical protein